MSSGESVEGLSTWAASWISAGSGAPVEEPLYTITRAGSISASEDEAVDWDWIVVTAAGSGWMTGAGEGSVDVKAEWDWTGEGSRSRPTVVLLSISPSYVGESTLSSDSMEGDMVCFKRDRDVGEEERAAEAPGPRC